MKKKILMSVSITVFFALIVLSIFFMWFYNMKIMDGVRADLVAENNYLSSLYKDNPDEIKKDSINGLSIDGSSVRITIINSNGDVTYDNNQDNLPNHSDRPEVQSALADGTGYSVRYSNTLREQMVYYAVKLDDGTIFRTSVSFDTVSFINIKNILYAFILISIVLIFSLTLSMKLVKTIVDPISELEDVTKKIAGGDLHIRVTPTTSDEIGKLGSTFNLMADQLQGKIREVLDKQSRYEAILTSMESGVIAVNNNYEVITINPYAMRVFGIKQNIDGQEISKYIKDYDIVNFLDAEDEVDKEIKLLHPALRELRIKRTYIINGNERIGKVIAVQDISDLKRLENMRSQFVANVSHELKTPLTSIKGFAETLKFVEDSETRNKFLDIIDNEAERLSRLINDILVLSKIESDVFSDNEVFMPNGIIDDVIDSLKHLADSKNIKLILEQANAKTLIGNSDKFHQLVLNLVENGIKYSNDGCYVKIKSYNDDDNYVLIVEDNGIGIPEEDAGRIFERFYRVDKARKSGGTGLGLAIVKHIVKSFNGEIELKSKVGEGSCFTVRLKL